MPFTDVETKKFLLQQDDRVSLSFQNLVSLNLKSNPVSLRMQTFHCSKYVAVMLLETLVFNGNATRMFSSPRNKNNGCF